MWARSGLNECLIPREGNGHPFGQWGDKMTISIPKPEPTGLYEHQRTGRLRESSMSSEENKRVVRRFVTEILSGGNTDVMDELLAPNYANPSMGVTNREGFKAVVSGLKAAMPTRDFEIANLVAEGDSVVLRGNMHFTPASGKRVSARVITYYRLVNGKIVEDEPITMPPLTDVLGGMMPPKSGP
jgi:predicted SnoaL-like aldol condensation-catalyzing enzyme